MKRLFIFTLVLLSSFGVAQEVHRVEFGLRDTVVGTWNPIVVHGRDLAGYTLQIDLLLGTLREVERTETITMLFPPGRGTIVLEHSFFVPTGARAIAWRVRNPDETIASGQETTQVNGEEPLVVYVGGPPPIAVREHGTRVVEVQAHEFSTQPVVYDGVAAIVLTGNGAAPSVESITAAVAMGATIILPEIAPPHYRALVQLAQVGADGLGAGTFSRNSSPTVEVISAAVESWTERTHARAEQLNQELELPALPLTGTTFAMAVLGYLVVVRGLTFVRGIPGIASALLVGAMACAFVITTLKDTGSHEEVLVSHVEHGGLARVDRADVTVQRGAEVVRIIHEPRLERTQ